MQFEANNSIQLAFLSAESFCSKLVESIETFCCCVNIETGAAKFGQSEMRETNGQTMIYCALMPLGQSKDSNDIMRLTDVRHKSKGTKSKKNSSSEGDILF